MLFDVVGELEQGGESPARCPSDVGDSGGDTIVASGFISRSDYPSVDGMLLEKTAWCRACL